MNINHENINKSLFYEIHYSNSLLCDTPMDPIMACCLDMYKNMAAIWRIDKSVALNSLAWVVLPHTSGFSNTRLSRLTGRN